MGRTNPDDDDGAKGDGADGAPRARVQTAAPSNDGGSEGPDGPAAPRSATSCLLHAVVLGALAFVAVRGPVRAWSWSVDAAANGVHADATVIERFEKTLVRETGADSSYEYEKPYVRLQYADPAGGEPTGGEHLRTLERPAEGREVGERVAIAVAPDGTVLVEPYGSGPVAIFLSRSPAVLDLARLVAAALFAVIAVLNLVALKDAGAPRDAAAS